MAKKIKVSLRVEIPGFDPQLRHDICVELTLLDTIGCGMVVKGEIVSPGGVVLDEFNGQGIRSYVR